MKRLDWPKKKTAWCGGVYYFGKLVGKVVRSYRPDMTPWGYVFVSESGKYEYWHYGNRHLQNHVRGWCDRQILESNSKR